MKNEFAPGRAYNNYFLKMVISAVAGSIKWMKTMLSMFRYAEEKPPFLADAVSEGLLDFFKEMGYSSKNKKHI
jgi:hypothetical protein